MIDPVTGLVVGGTLALGSAIAGAVGANKQEEASKEALAQQQAQYQSSALANAYSAAKARDEMRLGQQAGNQAMFEGLAGAGSNIRDWGMQARQDLSGGLGQARQDIAGGIGAAAQAYSPLQQYLGYGQQAGGMLSQLASQDPRQMAQMDPGYAFRQQQGEKALGRATAASGGRVSGRALQELAQFNQDLASQEYGNAVNRAMGVQQQQAGIANQLTGLGNVGVQAQGNLANLAMGGGQALGNLGQQYGQGMSGLASNLGTNLGNLGWQGGQALGNSLWGQQQAIGNTYQTSQGMTNAMGQQLMSQQGAAVPYAGGTAAAVGNAMGNVGGLALYAGMNKMMG